MSATLVINSGSSSLKYQLISNADESRIASGIIERIGHEDSILTHSQHGKSVTLEREIADHTAAFEAMEAAFSDAGEPLATLDVTAIGHRVVQGGSRFFAPTLITDEVAEDINELSILAPLHNPGQYQGIVAARQMFPQLPHVAVFDTAFHQTIPAAAHTYAIDANLAKEFRVRRYGFHGTSHQIVSERAAQFLDRPLTELKQIVLHLGSGASVCAVDGGISVDTSMGLTPLQGLIMGTRSGDIDPSVLFHLHRQAGLSIDQLDELLNKRSGLLGLTGDSDVRDVTARRAAGDPDAKLALDAYAYRIRHYIGAYMVALGGLDVITFTAGVGENSHLVRKLVCEGLEPFGIKLDSERNESGQRGRFEISADDSAVKLLVIPTDEELEISRQTRSLIAVA